jgi:DNA-binding NtrC family response regulator
MPDMTSNSITKSILAIDDESDIVNLIKQVLEKDGFQVYTFIDVLAAFEHFRSYFNHYDIIISDIRMPGMNGYEFVKQVKKINTKVKVILMSAFEINDREFHNLLPNIKIDAFLRKPFSIQRLNDVLEKIKVKD